MFTLKFGLYALGALAAAQSGLAAPAEDASVQYLPSKRDVIEEAPLYAEGGPKFTDVRKVFNFANQWFNAPLAACAATEAYRSLIKDRLSVKDDGTAVGEVAVNFPWTPNGPQKIVVQHAQTPVNSTNDPWWPSAIKWAATNRENLGIEGLNGDGGMTEGKPEDAYRLITNREAARVSNPTPDDLNKYIFWASAAAIAIGMGDSAENITTWSAITKADPGPTEEGSIGYYDFESGTEKTMSSSDAEKNVRALIIDKITAEAQVA
ncbi:hypothetical protein I317_00576 [Kwoniella heveanensis CBS 569]|nr:hypothetical protein I317_00576 [Kwoniella heveanensis CBS 569]